MTLPRWLTVFVLFLPAAAILHWLHQPASWVFVCAALAIAPLAGWMGQATEELAERFGPGIGGLLNATFGNAAEFIVSLLALRRGLTSLVKASLAGSIIGNLLLVTGVSLIAGGLRHGRQAFNRRTAALGSTLMALAVAGMLVPAMFHSLVQSPRIEKDLSLGISTLLFLVYILNLAFSLLGRHEVPREAPHRGSRAPNAARAFAILAAATLGVTGASELLVGAVEAAAKTWGMTTLFIGVIVVAVVGNAAENSTAVLMALKNKLDVSMAIATGSSLQIALLIAPVLVFLGALFHKPMDLHFTPFETLAIALAVGLGHLTMADGESNWLEGSLLVALYIMLAVAFFFLPERPV